MNKKILSVIIASAMMFSVIPAYATEAVPASETEDSVVAEEEVETDLPETEAESQQPSSPEEAEEEADLPPVRYEAAPKTTSEEDVVLDEGSDEIIEEGYFGKNGNNLYWSLTAGGDMVIKGSGSMGSKDFNVGYNDDGAYVDNRPWADVKNSIVTLTIEEGVTDMADNAFCNMKKLEEVYIPASMISITREIYEEDYEYEEDEEAYFYTEFPFLECRALEKIVVDENNDKYYTDENGVLYESASEGNKLIFFPSALSLDEYRVPSTVNYIGNYAFSCTMNLGYLNIRNNVTTINDYVFYMAEGIRKINLPACADEDAVLCAFSFGGMLGLEEITVVSNNPTYKSIDGILYKKDPNSSALTEIVKCPPRKSGVIDIEDGIKIVGYRAFENCRKITEINLPSSIIEYGSWAFSSCDSMKTFEIGPKVAEINQEAFAWSDFESFTVASGNKYFKAIDGVVYNKNGTKIIMVPAGRTGDFVVPKSVTQVGTWAFWNTKVDTVKFAGVVDIIEFDAFYGCGAREIEIPHGASHIGDYAFSDCENLEKITIPRTISDMGDYIFGDPSWDEDFNYDIVVYGYENSYAEGAAKVIGLEFVPLTDGSAAAYWLATYYENGVHQYLESSGILRLKPGSNTNKSFIVENLLVDNYDEDDDSEYWELLEKVWCIVIEDGVEGIGPGALGGLDNLKVIVVASDDIWTIGDDAFGWTWVYDEEKEDYEKEYLDDFTAYVKAGSEAFDYVTDNYINYEILTQDTCPRHMTSSKTTKAATTSANGKRTTYCKLCGKVTGTKEIAQIKSSSIKLNTTTYAYNGKLKKPTVTVKDVKGNKLEKGVDYTVTYSNNKSVGKATAKIKFTGWYSGTVSKTFTINPAAKSISSLSKGKKSFTVKWKKPSSTYRKQMTGYQIKYSTSSKMTSAKTVSVKSTTATSKTIKSLKAKKKYYVQLRTYKKIGSKYYYSAWSAKKAVTTK